MNNWLTNALIHETAHLYQFSARSKLSHALSYIMSPQSLFPPGWIAYPNLYFHDLILEGHAVFLESLYGSGGRLFSGWNRAIAFSQLKNGLHLKRILNLYDDPLSNLEKYIHGGYFYSYLFKKFGLSKLNEIFTVNGENLFFPLGFYAVNRAFKKTFQQDFPTLFKEYQNFYGKPAEKQVSGGGSILTQSRFPAPINSNGENVFFLVSDGKTPTQLAVMSKKTKKISLRPLHVPLGKVFFINGDYLSAGSGQTDTLSIQFSLFKDGFVPLEKYNSRYVMDVRGNKTLSFSAREALYEFRLYRNEIFLDTVHSSAVMDPRGRAYYFKQKGRNRILHRDKTPLYTYQGYYGFPVEADNSSVYFLAPTAHGSGLFVYRDGKVLRLSPSDTIVSARKIDEESWLVCEINNRFFEYKVVSAKPFPDHPVLYSYDFKKKPLADMKSPAESNADNRQTSKETAEKPGYLPGKAPEKLRKKTARQTAKDGSPLPEKTEEKAKPVGVPYNSISNLRFHRMDLLSNFNIRQAGSHLTIQPSLSFGDPLGYSLLSAKGLFSKKRKGGAVSYKYRKLRPVFYLNGYYQAETTQRKTQGFLGGLKYPLLVKEDWEVSLSAGLGWKTNKQRKKPTARFLTSEMSARYNFKRHYPHGFDAHRMEDLILFYKNDYEIKTKKNRPAYGLQFLLNRELGREFYISTEWEWQNRSRAGDIQWGFLFPKKSLSFFPNELWTTRALKNPLFISARFKKVLNRSLYSETLPLALRRFAPMAGVSFLSFKTRPPAGGFQILPSHESSPGNTPNPVPLNEPIKPNPTATVSPASSVIPAPPVISTPLAIPSQPGIPAPPVSPTNAGTSLNEPEKKEEAIPSIQPHLFLLQIPQTQKKPLLQRGIIYAFLGGETEWVLNHKAIVYVETAGGLIWERSGKKKWSAPSFGGHISFKTRF